MDEAERLELLKKWRQQFREGRPDLNLSPDGNTTSSKNERFKKEIVEKKKESLNETAKNHPKTMARLIEKVYGRHTK